jgi:hypothetical protein
VEIGRPLPAVDLHGQQLTGVHQVGHGRTGVVGAEPEVVAQATEGRDTLGSRRDPDQLPESLLLGHVGRRENGTREHALRQGIAPFELLRATCRRDLPRPEEKLHDLLGRRPVPAPGDALARMVVPQGSLDLLSGQRATAGHLLTDRTEQGRVLPSGAHHAAPRVVRGASHPVTEQPVRRGADEGRFVRPVLNQPPRSLAGRPVQQAAVIAPEPAEDRQIVAARQRVDRIDLQETDGVDDLLDLPQGGFARGTPPQALRRHGDPTGLRTEALPAPPRRPENRFWTGATLRDIAAGSTFTPGMLPPATDSLPTRPSPAGMPPMPAAGGEETPGTPQRRPGPATTPGAAWAEAAPGGSGWISRPVRGSARPRSRRPRA